MISQSVKVVKGKGVFDNLHWLWAREPWKFRSKKCRGKQQTNQTKLAENSCFSNLHKIEDLTTDKVKMDKLGSFWTKFWWF